MGQSGRERPEDPKASLERFFEAEQVRENLFTPSFLSRVSHFRLEQIRAEFEMNLGKYQGVQESEGEHLVLFEQGVVPARIRVNREGKIAGLLFQPPRARIIGLERVSGELQALSGTSGLLIIANGEKTYSLNSQLPLMVGSAFKIAVLATLQEQIDSAKRSWADIVELRSARKSLPSGLLQDWPEGSPLTLHTLATLMISISDNTATDILIDLIGRDALEGIAPHNRPFLSTREYFVLRDPTNLELADRYRLGSEADRHAVLEAIQAVPTPAAGTVEDAPVVANANWYFTLHELCTLMDRVQHIQAMSINPGLASPEDWERVAFKGGSGPGVLSLVTSLVAKDGTSYCVAAALNGNVPLDQARFFAVYGGVLKLLAGEP
jgi:beta-lactamase class A